MKGDISRRTFDHRRHYRGVRLQQGRLLLDADFNEQADIRSYRLGTTVADAVRVPAGPETGAGFEMFADGAGIRIGAGRLYVDGVLCVLEQEVEITAQPDLPGFLVPTATGSYLAYLDVWQHHVGALEDPGLLEPALEGAETATRLQTVCQVRLAAVAAGTDCGDFLPSWTPFGDPPPTAGTLLVRWVPSPGAELAPDRLYRVEIHESGSLGTATFKWARDNGSVALAVASFAASVMTLKPRPGLDFATHFVVDQWVEVTDPERILKMQAGDLMRITDVDAEALELVVDGTPTAGDGAIVRLWDSGDQISTAAGPLPLELGLEVEWSAGEFRSGDYWLIPSRSAAPSGLAWPVESGVHRQADGVRHSYAPLALLEHVDSAWSVRTDCRQFFQPTTVSLNPNKVDRIGDTMTGPLTIEADLFVTGHTRFGAKASPESDVPLHVDGAIQPALGTAGGILFPGGASLKASVNGQIGEFALASGAGIALRQANTDRMQLINNSVGIGLGVQEPQEALHVGMSEEDEIRATSLRVNGRFTLFDPEVNDGFVLTSDALGEASWQPIPADVGSSPGFLPDRLQVAAGTEEVAEFQSILIPESVPRGITAVILEGQATFVNNSQGTVKVLVRKSPNDAEYLLVQGETGGTSLGQIVGTGSANQGVFPVTSDGTFEYKVDGGLVTSWEIWLIGYFV